MPVPTRPMLGPDPRRLSHEQRSLVVERLAATGTPGALHLADLYAHCRSFYPGFEGGLPREDDGVLPMSIARAVTLSGGSPAALCLEVAG